MLLNKSANNKLAAAAVSLLSAVSFSSYADTASYDPATSILDLPIVEVLNGKVSTTFSAQLKLVDPVKLEFTAVSAVPATPVIGQRNVFDAVTNAVHIPAISFGDGEYYAKLKLIPGSNPMRFSLDQFVNNEFQGCPSFSSEGPVSGSCLLSGEIKQDITLTKNTQWILSGGVFIGGDKTDNATLTINPGTKIFGQQGADYLWIRRGSKIMSEGTPDNPVVMTGPLQQSAGEWGGLVIAGYAPVNGCNEDVALCEVVFEAVTSESYGGNEPNDNSGLLKYTQILFAGFAVRPDEELNGLTLNGVGARTVIDFVQVHAGLDDGVEMFGGTVQMKHLVLTHIGDDSLDWGIGWRGKAQYVLVQQAADDGDRGIEADNNGDNPDLDPRSKPTLSNLTMIGSAVGSQGALLRRGTGVNIWNSVFTGFGSSCLKLDGEATYVNAGAPGDLTGELTMVHSYVDCTTNFSDGKGATFAVGDWFNTQMMNKAADPILNGYLPGVGSPLPTGGMPVGDSFFDSVSYVGAFADANDDWTKEWTFAF